MVESPARDQQQVETIIDLDRHEILSILRDVQEVSVTVDHAVDHAADPYIDRHLS